MKLTAQAILDRGWTGTMIRDLLGEPDEYAPNPRYRSAAPCKLYDIVRVARAEATGEYAERVARLEAWRRGKDYESEFQRQYGNGGSTPALCDAAQGLFSLNRYAKHGTCSKAHRTDIYDLKNRLLRALFDWGHCTGWNHHELVKPKKALPCYCAGYFNEEDAEGCHRCDFTGIHKILPELRLPFVAFRFEIDGRSYTWHQPKELVRWDYSAVPQYQDANDWQPEAEKPLELSRRQFAQAKALIRWVLARPLGTKEAQ